MTGIEWLTPTIAIGVSVSILGFFVKRMINGMGRDIESLDAKKLDKELWGKHNDLVCNEISRVSNQVNEVHADLKEFTKEIRHFVSDNPTDRWDGRERRRGNN